MSDVHVINALLRETRELLLPLLLHLEQMGQELVDIRWRHVVPVRPLDEGLALQVEDGDQAGHGGEGEGCEAA